MQQSDVIMLLISLCDSSFKMQHAWFQLTQTDWNGKVLFKGFLFVLLQSNYCQDRILHLKSALPAGNSLFPNLSLHYQFNLPICLNSWHIKTWLCNCTLEKTFFSMNFEPVLMAWNNLWMKLRETNGPAGWSRYSRKWNGIQLEMATVQYEHKKCQK